MARRDALLRLHKSLLSRRADIRKKLADELDGLRNLKGADAGGDAADVAFESDSEEMASQLAELDSRELHQIERALHRLKQGTYGLCEGCGGKIPVDRLNALPYSTLCIACQREKEKYLDWGDRRSTGSWEKVCDAAPREDSFDADALPPKADVAGEALQTYQQFTTVVVSPDSSRVPASGRPSSVETSALSLGGKPSPRG